MKNRIPKRFRIMLMAMSMATAFVLGSATADESTRAGYAELDAAIRSLPSQASIREVADAISTRASGDWQRVRAAFVWVAHNIAYDANAYFSGRRSATSAEDVFASRRSVCQGYAELFAAIVRELGMDVRVVSGYAKGYSYRPGQSFRSTNHAWNAVLVEGNLHLFDTTWAAGHVSNGRHVRDFSGYWFAPDPDLFVRTHLPRDPQWQLTSTEVSKHTFENQTHVPSYTFEALWRLGFTSEQVLTSLNGNAGLPAAYNTDDVPVSVAAAPLSTHVPAGREVHIRLRVPDDQPGAIINNGDWTYLQREGDYLVGHISPERGSLKISLKLDPNESGYRTVLRYGVE